MDAIEVAQLTERLLKCWREESKDLDIPDIDQVLILRSASSIYEERIGAASRIMIMTEALNSIRRR